MGFKPAVLTGYYVCPNPNCSNHGKPHDVLITGNPMIVGEILMRMGFGQDDMRPLEPGEPTLLCTDDRGSYLLMKPAESAENMLAEFISEEMGPQSPF